MMLPRTMPRVSSAQRRSKLMYHKTASVIGKGWAADAGMVLSIMLLAADIMHRSTGVPLYGLELMWTEHAGS